MKCPLLNKKCMEAECYWFGEFLIHKNPGDEPHVERGCVVPRIPGMILQLLKNTDGHAQAQEQVRNRLEHIATHTKAQATILATMAQASLDRHELQEPEPRKVLHAGSARE